MTFDVRVRLFLLAGVIFLAGTLPCMSAESGWMTDYGKAMERAKAEKKPVLLLLTGSDWCPPCMLQKKEIFETGEFKKYAAQSVVLLEADFPRRKSLPEKLQRQNEELSVRFYPNGDLPTPTLILLRSDGKEIWRQEGYRRSTPKEFIAELKEQIPAK